MILLVTVTNHYRSVSNFFIYLLQAMHHYHTKNMCSYVCIHSCLIYGTLTFSGVIGVGVSGSAAAGGTGVWCRGGADWAEGSGDWCESKIDGGMLYADSGPVWYEGCIGGKVGKVKDGIGNANKLSRGLKPHPKQFGCGGGQVHGGGGDCNLKCSHP